MAELVKFSEFVDFPLKCHNVLGLNPLDVDADTKWSKCKKLHRVSIRVIVLIDILLGIIYIHEKIGNLVEVTEKASTNTSTIIGFVKLVTLSIAKENFKEVITALDDLFPKTKEEQKIFKVKKYIDGYKRLERIMVLAVTTTTMTFIIGGIIAKKLPFPTWYPFDGYDPRFVGFVFVSQLLSTFVIINSLMGPDLMFFSVITMIQMHFDCLILRLKEVKSLPLEEAEKKLVELIKMHQNLIKISQNLEKVYSTSILFNFIGSSGLLCLIGFQVSIVSSLQSFMVFVLFLGTALQAVFMQCFYGEKLTTANGKIAEIVYDLPWEEKEYRRLKFTLTMMIQQSQKPNVITIGKCSTVSLQAFTGILSWSYSCMTLLLGLYSKA